MKMKIVIVNETNLSIEKGDNENELKLHLYGEKDKNMDGKPDGEMIIVTREILDKAINFILPPTPPAPPITPL